MPRLNIIDWSNDAPIDLCAECYMNNEYLDDVEHPPYEDQSPPYRCFNCGNQLRAIDNWCYIERTDS